MSGKGTGLSTFHGEKLEKIVMFPFSVNDNDYLQLKIIDKDLFLPRTRKA
jgi:hypothetical protein